MGQQDGGSPAPDTRPDLQSTPDRVALWGKSRQAEACQNHMPMASWQAWNRVTEHPGQQN